MINFVPLFPLNLVVFPGEALNLHIFEERYRQLIHDCRTQAKPFGIPAVINGEVSEYGTLVHIEAVDKEYPDGRLDIKTRGGQVFQLLEKVQQLPGKLYHGGIASYPANELGPSPRQMEKLLPQLKELHQLLKVNKEFPKTVEDLLSYDIAHHAGLGLEEEYELLQLLREDQRLEYLKRHLQKIVPAAARLEALKERVQMNGHFKELKGFDFGDV